MKKYLLSTLALGMITTGLHATCTPMATGALCQYTNIDRLYVTPSVTYVSTTDDEAASISEKCDVKSGKYLTLKTSTPNYDKIHDLLTAAQATGKEIWVRVAPDSNNLCNVVYVTMEN